MYPNEIADALGVEVKTVKNRLSTLRKEGKIKDTGETHKQARQVSLVSPTYRDGDGDPNTTIHSNSDDDDFEDLFNDPWLWEEVYDPRTKMMVPACFSKTLTSPSP